VEKAGKRIGVIVGPSTSIDFVVLGLAIFLGGLVGVLVTFPIGGIKIAPSTSVGTLLAGLLVGYLHTLYPHFGRIPDGAISLMTSLGLAAFVGLTGIHAGPLFPSALWESGIGLLLSGHCRDLAAAARRVLLWCVYRKLKSGRGGDEVRQRACELMTPEGCNLASRDVCRSNQC
jgi:uncharacterized transporter YbjL